MHLMNETVVQHNAHALPAAEQRAHRRRITDTIPGDKHERRKILWAPSVRAQWVRDEPVTRGLSERDPGICQYERARIMRFRGILGADATDFEGWT